MFSDVKDANSGAASTQPSTKPQNHKGKGRADTPDLSLPRQQFDPHDYTVSDDIYDEDCRLSLSSDGDDTDDDLDQDDAKEDSGRKLFDKIEIKSAARESAKAKLPPLSEDDLAVSRYLLTKVTLGLRHSPFCSNFLFFPFLKMSHIAKRIRYSNHIYSIYSAECNSIGKKTVKPKRDVKTRWNSTILMLMSFTSYRLAIDSTIERCDELWDFAISDAEWVIAYGLIPVLEVSHPTLSTIPLADKLRQGFLHATRIVSQSGVPLMHQVIPIFDDLHDGLVATIANWRLPLCIRHGAARAKTKLDKYYDKSDSAHAARFAMSTYQPFFIQITTNNPS